MSTLGVHDELKGDIIMVKMIGPGLLLDSFELLLDQSINEGAMLLISCCCLVRQGYEISEITCHKCISHQSLNKDMLQIRFG